ncbi:MAG: sulfatase [Planctomycetaceae bacterium]
MSSVSLQVPKWSLVVVLWSLLTSGGESVTFGAEGGGKPNVLFIAVDDLNDWIAPLGGYPGCQTPNLDRLAARGMLFTRAYCAAPACNPSRASLMTGIRPWTSGVYINPQPWRKSPVLKEIDTLPQALMKGGYEAVGAGKIYHGGFDDDASWNDYLKKGGDPKPNPAVANDPHSKAGGIVWGVLDVEDQQMADHKTANYAIDYLGKKHEKPFFLGCGIYRPHMPWQVPRKYYERYPLESIQLPKVIKDDLGDIPAAGRKMAGAAGDHATILKTDNWKYAVQGYLASITFADAQIGRVLDALDQSPYRDNTIIVLWGDHGWHLGEKEHWRKFALWEEATRVPLIISVPGMTPAGSRCERTVDLMHLYPTLTELCGVPTADRLEGVSIVPLLKSPDTAWDRPAMTTHGRGNHAVRSERFRYIRYADGSEELYDHTVDPLEWKNLASDAAFSEEKTALAQWLPRQEAPPSAGTNDVDGDSAPPKKRGGKKKQPAAADAP